MQHAQQSEITLEQIDRELAAWQNRLTVVSSNLIELDDLTTFKRLKGELDTLPVLTGTTQQRVAPSLEAVRKLWQYLQLLNDTIGKATELRKAMPRLWTTDNTLSRLYDLLHGQSIVLPPLETPLAQRELLSASQTAQTTTPDLLLTAMTHVFTEVKATILAVDAAWNRLEPALADAMQYAGGLQQQALSLGEGSLPELNRVQQEIGRLQAAIACDPLGTDANFNRDVQPLLQRTRERLDELVRQRQRMQADLQNAAALVQALRETHAHCETALNRCREKIAETEGLRAPLDSAAIADLERWLETLHDTAQQQHWKALRVGLDRFLPAANAYLDAERTSLAANQAALDTIAELRGRLNALKAKAQAMQSRGTILDETLPALANQAENCLYTPPMALSQAARLVSEYEVRLNKK